MSMQKKPKVLITDPLADEGVELIRERCDVELAYGISADELERTIPGYDGLVVRSGTKVTARVIEAGTRLRVIGRAGSGLDNIDVTSARAMGIEVCNCPGANSVAVAEHTMALLLALARHIPTADLSLKEGRWEKKQLKGVGLTGRRLGLIGFGRIGRQVAKRAQAFGMTVLVNQPRLTPELALEAGVVACDLPDLLRQADFVTLHLPLRPENINLISREELALMKPEAYLINTARGGIVDEAALLEALNEGRLAGAGVDVFEEEPATDSELAKHPKVIASPHIAASTDEAQRNAAVAIAEQINDILCSGEVAQSLSLEVVPTSEVIPHEGFDPKRAEKLAASLEADGLLVNPPVVALHRDKYIVLDGATRTTAFKQLGIPHIIVQIIDPERADVSLHTWYHVVSGDSPAALLEELQKVEGLNLTEIEPKAAQNLLREREALSYFAFADGRVFLAELASEEDDRMEVLNRLVERYTLWGEVARTLTTDQEQLAAAFPQITALVVFPQFKPEMALNAAVEGKPLPQGITRFVIPGRVLRLNTPLEILQSQDPLPAKRRWLDQFIRDKIDRARVRYYQEPVVLLED